MTYNKTSKTWTINDATRVLEAQKSVYAKLVKIAQDEITAADGTAPTEAGTAGPQEVIDALEQVVSEIEVIQDAIPGDAPQDEEEVVNEQIEAPVDEPPREEVAKLQSKVAELESEIDSTKKERIAKEYAELFENPKVQNAKYEEVITSKESTSFWNTKVAAIQQYREEQGIESYKPAQTISSWLKPQTKFAKQSGEEILHL